MKKAFTMMELIFVLVVMGIIAAVVLPNTRSNPVAEAGVELASQIRFTQHLALINDKYATDATWYKNRWQIVFSGTDNNFYSVVSDNNTTFAKDPLKGLPIQDVALTGVSLSFTGGCNGKTTLSFDHLGRPLVGSLAAMTQPYVAAGTNGELLSSDCTITITDGSENSVITLTRETGYVKLQ